MPGDGNQKGIATVFKRGRGRYQKTMTPHGIFITEPTCKAIWKQMTCEFWTWKQCSQGWPHSGLSEQGDAQLTSEHTGIWNQQSSWWSFIILRNKSQIILEIGIFMQIQQLCLKPSLTYLILEGYCKSYQILNFLKKSQIKWRWFSQLEEISKVIFFKSTVLHRYMGTRQHVRSSSQRLWASSTWGILEQIPTVSTWSLWMKKGSQPKPNKLRGGHMARALHTQRPKVTIENSLNINIHKSRWRSWLVVTP